MNIVICVPIYENTLNCFEEASLKQLWRVLNNYPIVFVAPDCLEFDFRDVVPTYSAERFSDEFFLSTATYSRLLLSEHFYNRFMDYEWMLVYQLDAFVFDDRLNEFVDSGYDYIGAPVCGGLFDVVGSYVGNGGLSLRNIERTKKLLLEIGSDFFSGAFLELKCAEDVFFAYCGAREDIDYITADIETASEFSIEFNINFAIDKMKEGVLPFGTHFWYKHDYDIWKSIIETLYGYTLPACDSVEYYDVYDRGTDWWYFYLKLENLYKLDEKTINKRIHDVGLGYFYRVRIWGAGLCGRRCLRILKALRIDVDYIYDNRMDALYLSLDLSTEIKCPDENAFANEHGRVVVVAMDKPGEDVFGLLSESGLEEGNEFVLYQTFMSDVDRLYEEFSW